MLESEKLTTVVGQAGGKHSHFAWPASSNPRCGVGGVETLFAAQSQRHHTTDFAEEVYKHVTVHLPGKGEIQPLSNTAIPDGTGNSSDVMERKRAFPHD